MTHRILVVTVKSGGAFNAHAPEYPECRATASTADKARRQLADTLEQHLRDACAAGTPTSPVDIDYGFLMVDVPDR